MLIACTGMLMCSSLYVQGTPGPNNQRPFDLTFTRHRAGRSPAVTFIAAGGIGTMLMHSTPLPPASPGRTAAVILVPRRRRHEDHVGRVDGDDLARQQELGDCDNKGGAGGDGDGLTSVDGRRCVERAGDPHADLVVAAAARAPAL
ncbi:hypothetical protein [Nannocystis pusilla]|uniref:Uncharacterized protein n=1 Tax=Nannocystis pusilla TaxID=889268 RepID=A0ABS7TJE0_9BACT|nr:hypothetical protein [Nannocystis pusilla]MBZ5708343.1 hypothetical protein [Nannocystis pusilla]